MGANPLTLGSDTCVLLGGTIQLSSSTGANCAINATSGAGYISISGGTIDGGTTSSAGAGHNAIYFSGVSMFQIDAVTMQNFGTGGSTLVTNIGSVATAALSTTWTRYSVAIAVPSAAGKTFGIGPHALHIARRQIDRCRTVGRQLGCLRRKRQCGAQS